MSEGPIITGRLRLKDETGKTLTSIKNKIGSAFKVIAKGTLLAGAAATAGIGLSIKAAADFEEALARIIAASGETGEGAEALKESLSDAAMALGPEFGISATSAVEALEALVKAGLEGEDAIDALQGSLQLAALEGLGTAEASNMLVAAMTMFGLEAKDAGKIIDSFSAASDAGIGTAGDYAKGLSMDETMAALVQLDNTFGSAQAGGTFLNRMLLDMSAKAEDAGLELYNVDGSMKSLDEIMGQVRGVLQGFGDDQESVNKWLGQFDTRAQKAIIGLSGYSETISDTEKKLGDMQSAQSKVNIILDTFSGRMKVAKSRIQAMSVSLGKRLMPYAETALDVFDDFLPVIEDLITGFGKFAARVWDVARALATGNWNEAWDMIEETYSNISSKFAEWFDEIEWSMVWGKARLYLGALYYKFKTWAGNISTAFIAWWAEIDWTAVWKKLQTFTEALFNAIEEWAGDISKFFVDWWKTTDWDKVWKGLKTYVSLLWTKLTEWAGDIGTAFLNWFGEINWNTVFNELSEWMEGFFDWLFGKPEEDIESAFTKWVDTVDWGAVFYSLASFAINLPMWIWQQVNNATTGLGEYMARYIAAIEWGDVFYAIGEGIVNTMKGAADRILSWMPKWLKMMLGLEDITTPTIPAPSPPPPPPLPPPSDEPPSWLPPIYAAKTGFEGVVDRPTAFLAGEGGVPEYVSITPRRRGGSTIIFNFKFEVSGNMDEEACKQVSDYILMRTQSRL